MLKQFVALANAEPGAVAVVDGATGACTTRIELLARGSALADRLSADGFGAGDLLAVQLPNSVDFIATFLAVLKLGLVAVPLDRDATETEVANVVSHFGVRGVAYRRTRESAEVEINRRPATASPDLPAGARLLKLSSGSTGRPKGIVTSEANLIADCTNIVSSMTIGPRDLNFGAIPLSHSYGFSNLVAPLLLRGTALVISNDYLPQAILELCNRFRCTVFPGIPMVFDHLASLPPQDGGFETVRTFISAGAPLSPATSRRFRERYGADIHSFYGCSECGGITYDRDGAAVEHANVGRAMDNVTLDANDSGRLTIRSSAVALGYLHDANTFEPFAGNVFVSDDLAAISPDGTVTLTGRASEMINTAGKKVNPREIEQVLMQLEGVREVKVWGEPAGARGEVVAAAIVGTPDLSRERIRAFCRERLSLHKVPRIVKLIDALPVDERGKVRKSLLAEL